MLDLRQEGFEMIKMVNLCNHCDVIENCVVFTFFCDVSVLFQKMGSNKSNIPQLKDILKPYQRNTFLSMKTHALESSLLT